MSFYLFFFSGNAEERRGTVPLNLPTGRMEGSSPYGGEGRLHIDDRLRESLDSF